MINSARSSFSVFVAAFIGAGGATILVLWWAGILPPLPILGGSVAHCNVLKVPVYGDIVTVRPEMPSSSEGGGGGGGGDESAQSDSTLAVSTEIEDTLRAASAEPSIKALLVDIDSGGGGSVAGVEIAAAVARFGKPTVAVIHEVGASSAYLAAAAANIIFASEESSVGSIGVTGSYVEQSKKNEKEGITFHQLSSGPYKDVFSPDKPLTEAERARIMRDIQTSHDNFVRDVAEYRHMPIEKVAALADGWAPLGKAALEAGLIDRIGGTEEALAYLKEAVGEAPALCTW